MNNTLFKSLDEITKDLESKSLADVFRVVSFIPFERYEQHKHMRIEMDYVKKGSCIIQLENESISFKENELIIILSNVSHSFQAGTDGCTLMQLEFMPELFFQNVKEDATEDSKALFSSQAFSSDSRIIRIANNVRIMRAIERIVTEMNTRNSYYRHLVILYYTELLLLIQRHMDETYLPLCNNEMMRKSIDYIRQNFKEEINIGDISAHSGISERYLRKIFTQYLNMSPLDYLTQIRINSAIEMLRITDMSIKEVCFQCGFQSPQYFSRIFKQQTGVSPKDITK
jgi:AraC-like DNA-binding protein/quercetin dioxygenase-like cupin family protein